MKVRRITKKKPVLKQKARMPMVLERVSPVRTAVRRPVDDLPTKREWPLFARFVATTLVLFFVFVPVGDAYADMPDGSTEVVAVESPVPVAPEPAIEEVVVETSETMPEEVVDQEAVLEVILESGTTVEEIVDETVVEDGTSAEVPVLETANDEATTSPDIIPETESDTTDSEISSSTPVENETTGNETPIDESLDTATSTEPTPEPVATTTPPVDETITPVSDEVEVIATTTATTSEEIVATTTDASVEVSTHTTDADRFTFGVTECVAMGNGAFQCVRGGESGSASEARGPLYAAKDANGDMEIYLSTETGTRPITANEYDDDAPSVDPITGDIVWQAQIDDRTQIMHYNRETGATTRITKEAYNSMQPSIYEGDIVFQAWIGNDWEIVLVDETEGREILTDNAGHDITPSITNEYIMWQAFEGEEWVGKVYDRRTTEIETVRGMDGGKVENPRMIMVFDSTKENGDTDTLGYDPVSGEVVSLAVTPVPVAPERIPEPEPEQEEKALVQPSVTTRTETKNSTSTDPENGDTATSIEPAVEPIVLTAASSTIDMVVAATTSDDGVPTIEYGPLPPAEILPVIPDIPDLVIPAFSSSANDEATTSPSE